MTAGIAANLGMAPTREAFAAASIEETGGRAERRLAKHERWRRPGLALPALRYRPASVRPVARRRPPAGDADRADRSWCRRRRAGTRGQHLAGIQHRRQQERRRPRSDRAAGRPGRPGPAAGLPPAITYRRGVEHLPGTSFAGLRRASAGCSAPGTAWTCRFAFDLLDAQGVATVADHDPPQGLADRGVQDDPLRDVRGIWAGVI